jgi:hypothetical protein
MSEDQQYQPHEFCFLADRHSPAEMAELEASMRRQGFLGQYKIVLYEGKVLDGWGRYQAALNVGEPPLFRVFQGTREAALDFAYYSLFARRHTPKGQLAMIAAKFEKAKVDRGELPRTHEEIAKQAGTSQSFVAQAMSVQQRDPVIGERVAKGDMSLSRAYKELTRAVPQEPVKTDDKLADVWVTKEKWLLVIARFEELAARDIDPLFARRGSERILAGVTTKTKQGELIKLGRNMLIEQITLIRMNLPAKACSHCLGDGCDVCGFKGWLSVAEFKAREGDV